jgi:organic hydroperoxide reductase OsmC/OhrA
MTMAVLRIIASFLSSFVRRVIAMCLPYKILIFENTTNMKTHHFTGALEWSGNLGTGTSAYDQYGRNFEVISPGKFPIQGSADPAFRGDAQRINPEDFFLNALSSCHMLWYFHLCADAGVVVTDYRDEYEGILEIAAGGLGRISSVTLRPKVTIDFEKSVENAQELAISLHHKAHEKCFIANSVNTTVNCEPIAIAK